MNNLSFHITDIVANSMRAGASQVTIVLTLTQEMITIEVKDNGCGMDKETLQRATNPFYTTRTTRKVGLGLPFLIQNAEQTGGNVVVESMPGKGTTVIARFMASHIDCPPWGDLAGTIATLITGNPEVNIVFRYIMEKTGRNEQNHFAMQTEEIMEALDGIPLSLPKVTLWLTEMIRENVDLA